MRYKHSNISAKYQFLVKKGFSNEGPRLQVNWTQAERMATLNTYSFHFNNTLLSSAEMLLVNYKRKWRHSICTTPYSMLPNSVVWTKHTH